VSANRGIAWDEQPLGVVSDAELSRVLGVRTSAVWRARTHRGIACARSRRARRTRDPVAAKRHQDAYVARRRERFGSMYTDEQRARRAAWQRARDAKRKQTKAQAKQVAARVLACVDFGGDW
jgi:hypothetical protein